jgi:hypothetical protein
MHMGVLKRDYTHTSRKGCGISRQPPAESENDRLNVLIGSKHSSFSRIIRIILVERLSGHTVWKNFCMMIMSTFLKRCSLSSH